jgi:hypothetical protein
LDSIDDYEIIDADEYVGEDGKCIMMMFYPKEYDDLVLLYFLTYWLKPMYAGHSADAPADAAQNNEQEGLSQATPARTVQPNMGSPGSSARRKLVIRLSGSSRRIPATRIGKMSILKCMSRCILF